MKIIDLSHTFTNNMPVYPGDSKPEIKQTGSLETEGYNWFRIHTGLHVGTHIDSPLHFIEGGKFISDFPPGKFIGNGILIDARGKKEIDADLLNNHDIKPGDIVLILTGFSVFYNEKKYFEDYPVMTKDFAEKLIESDIKMVGADTPSPDKSPYDIHKMLLSQDILIIENLTNLETLLQVENFEVIALPPKLETEAAFARVIVRI